MKFCGSTGGGPELDKQFAALSLQPKTLLHSKYAPSNTAEKIKDGKDEFTALPTSSTQIPAPPPSTTSKTQPSPELEMILMAMRKLREAIVATRRRDDFAQRSYIFLLRASILCGHWESYVPTLLYLLYEIHPLTPLPPHELSECAIYYILDSACRTSDLPLAYTIKLQYSITDRRVEAILRALVMDNWCLFWKVRRRVDGFQRAILGWAEQGVRLHALKCLGKTYFTADRSFVERTTGMEWAGLVGEGVGWELGDADVVVIRKVKGK
jgi:hypothetical protein